MCGFLLGRGIVQAEEKVEILIILHKLTSHKKKRRGIATAGFFDGVMDSIKPRHRSHERQKYSIAFKPQGYLLDLFNFEKG
jgi:hypothetical protein